MPSATSWASGARVLTDHRNEIMLGNGKTGEWARNNVLGDLDGLAATVRAMNPAWRGTGVQWVRPRLVNFDFASRPGHALFKRLCAGCHTIGQGRSRGAGSARHNRAPRSRLAHQFISEPAKMRRRKDPVALALVAKFPNVRMPPLGVSANDAADLIAYMEARQQPAFSLAPLSALTTHNGTKFSLEHVKGQPTAVVFGFTHCPDVCPTTLLDWSNVLSSLGPDGDRLKVLFVSVDTESPRRRWRAARRHGQPERLGGL